MFDLTGQTAIVTGAATGIGKSVVDFLTAAGAKVAIADYNPQLAQQTADAFCAEGRDVVMLHTDVSKADMVAAMARNAYERWGRIDILVNNAGILADKFIEEISEEEWDRMTDIHIKGTFLCVQAVMPYMLERNYGRIVNISSLGARQGIYYAGSHYCAGKGGVVGFSRQLAQQIYRRGQNITINTVAPGTVKTPLANFVLFLELHDRKRQ